MAGSAVAVNFANQSSVSRSQCPDKVEHRVEFVALRGTALDTHAVPEILRIICVVESFNAP
jgi:hypothetical protein